MCVEAKLTCQVCVLLQGLRFIGVMTSMLGILYFSVIMGFVVDGIREKMDSLKKGKSRVAEDKHTVRLAATRSCAMSLRG